MPIPFRIVIDSDRLIRGDVYPSREKAQATLVICHGYKGFKDWGMFPYVAEQLSEHLDVITFNFSHNGVGEDPLEFTELDKFAVNTYSRELEDLHVLVESIRQGSLRMEQEVRTHPVFLLGHSRGGGVSLIYSYDHPELIDGVISWNGMTNVDLFTEEEKQEMRSKGRAYVVNARTKQQMPLDVAILEDMETNQERFNIINRVKSAETPIALIQGSEDFQRLRKGSEALIATNPSIPWIQIPDGNHTFKTVHPFQGTTEPLEKAIYHTKQYIKTWIDKFNAE